MSPPRALPCPPMYFVAEYTRMFAPNFSGLQTIGSRVLSSTSGTPAWSASPATSSMGKMRSLGLGRVSPK